MRRQVAITAVAALSLSLLLPPVASAEAGDEPRARGEAGNDNASVVISNPGSSSPGTSGAGEPGTRRVRRRSGGGQQPRHAVVSYELRTGPEGRCLGQTTSYRGTPITSQEELANAANRSGAADMGIPACDTAETPEPTAPLVSPAEVAEAFLRTVPLPLPEPHVAPDGQAITGLAAFLETNGSLRHTLGPEPTALGPIAVEATGAYWVDWGDGSPEAGPFSFEGKAYPSGRIFHHYRYTGTYTVTLRQTWTAAWRLGGDQGTVDGLVTETTLPVEVFQVQAVIRR